jgi:hypothetical protein
MKIPETHKILLGMGIVEHLTVIFWILNNEVDYSQSQSNIDREEMINVLVQVPLYLM